ncbi:MAG: hypothetical protein RIA64_10700 [Rhodospirillales bacterium]
MTMRPELDTIAAERADGIATATGSARGMLALIEHLVAASQCPIERRELRLQAVAIRRTLIAIMKAPSPFVRPVATPMPDVTVTPPVDAPRVPRRVAVQPQQNGAP